MVTHPSYQVHPGENTCPRQAWAANPSTNKTGSQDGRS